MNGLGGVACGRNVLGPFSWTYMGHNDDLQPAAKVGSGVVWMRTAATHITTVFTAGSGKHHHHGSGADQPPSMSVDALDRGLEVTGTTNCSAAQKSSAGWEVVCALGPHDATQSVRTVALRIHAEKTLVLRTTTLS